VHTAALETSVDKSLEPACTHCNIILNFSTRGILPTKPPATDSDIDANQANILPEMVDMWCEGSSMKKGWFAATNNLNLVSMLIRRPINPYWGGT
jgi:hypothetical protein